MLAVHQRHDDGVHVEAECRFSGVNVFDASAQFGQHSGHGEEVALIFAVQGVHSEVEVFQLCYSVDFGDRLTGQSELLLTDSQSQVDLCLAKDGGRIGLDE